MPFASNSGVADREYRSCAGHAGGGRDDPVPHHDLGSFDVGDQQRLRHRVVGVVEGVEDGEVFRNGGGDAPDDHEVLHSHDADALVEGTEQVGEHGVARRLGQLDVEGLVQQHEPGVGPVVLAQHLPAQRLPFGAQVRQPALVMGQPGTERSANGEAFQAEAHLVALLRRGDIGRIGAQPTVG